MSVVKCYLCWNVVKPARLNVMGVVFDTSLVMIMVENTIIKSLKAFPSQSEGT